MLSVHTLKSFIGHPDERVRRNIIQYIDEGNITVPEILPLALDVFDRYNNIENVFLIYHCKGQPVSEESAERLLEKIENAESYIIAMHLAVLLNNAPLSWLEGRIERLKSFDEHSWNKATVRLKIKEHSPENLWEELKTYSDECNNRFVDKIYVAALVETLGRYDVPDEDTICRMLQEEAISDQWLEIFLVDLAGARKIGRTVGIINDKILLDEAYLSERCVYALSRFGTVEAVEAVKNGFVERPWYYQLYASSVLSNIKARYSEKAILELLEQKGRYEDDIFYKLCFSLCDQFSKEAFKWGMPIINEPEACQIDSMREYLLVLSEILGVELSEAPQWEKEVEADYEKMFRRQSRAGKLGQKIKKQMAQTGELRQHSELDIPVHDDLTGAPAPRGDRKIGRNEPCPCGSGKKYKKCCGRL